MTAEVGWGPLVLLGRMGIKAEIRAGGMGQWLDFCPRSKEFGSSPSCSGPGPQGVVLAFWSPVSLWVFPYPSCSWALFLRDHSINLIKPSYWLCLSLLMEYFDFENGERREQGGERSVQAEGGGS